MSIQGIRAVAESIQFFAAAMMGLLWTGVMAGIVGLCIYGIVQGEVVKTLATAGFGVLFILGGVCIILLERSI